MLIFDNACEGRERGRAATVTLEARVDEANALVEITINDDGPGFPESIVRRAKVDGSHKREGLGVGLSVVRGFVEASGGTVRFSNRAAGGAVVTLTLPLGG